MPTVTIQQAFALAVQHHQAGRLADAEALYRQILAAHPDHADALHHLGIIAHQVGRNDLAVEWIRQSIVLDPNNPAAHSNIGEAYRAIGKFEEAIAAYRSALQLKPDYEEAYYNLGNALCSLNRLEEAIVAYQRALELNPGYGDAYNNLGLAFAEHGWLDKSIAAYRSALQLKSNVATTHYNLANVLKQLGQVAEAITEYRRALDLQADYPQASYNLGNALNELGQLDEAITAYRQVLHLKPDHAGAYNNLGNALRKRGQLDEAVAAFRSSLQIKADQPETYNNLGATLNQLGQLNEAIAAYRLALHLKADFAPIHYNLGNAFRDRGQLDEAIAAYRHALLLDSNYPEACLNLGTVLRDRGQLDAAVATFRHSLQLKPNWPDAYNNLGGVLRDQGYLDEAITAFRHALRLKPEHAVVHSNLIYALHFRPGESDSAISNEQDCWNRQFCDRLKGFIVPHANDRDPTRRLRVGYVSPDFCEHVVGRNLMPSFQRQDRQNFEILCYSGVVRPDGLTEEFRRRSAEWRSTVGVTDESLAEMIRQDRVDILVDLAQRLAGNRLPVFARQPAPVQVSFAGYPDSTGLEAIEYRISDRYIEAETGLFPGRERPPSVPYPEGKEQVFLIDSFWCYDPCGVEMAVNALPAAEGGGITFGSLNNFCKINEPILRLWAQMLQRVKGSRLVLLSHAGSHRQRTLAFLEREGVARERVAFVEPGARQAYLELYHQLDIALDPFPYNGHTTSLDALWMGVPVVSLAGETRVSRGGLSILSNLGLPELVTFSKDEYVQIAVELAGDLRRLPELRATLRQRMEASVLMDAQRFASSIEAAYRAMWRRWCAEKPGAS